MLFNIELHPEAIMEIEESYQWYEDRSEGLGVRFLDAVNKRLTEIARQPELYPKKKRNYREVAIENFPFTIIFEALTNEKIILVSYIFHSKRNPRLKYKER